MYNVHVPGESQSKPNIIHLWFIQFVLTFLMLQSYTFKRFLLLHVFFFHYTILYLYFLNFLLQVTCLHFSLSPKIFLIFFIFTFLLLATPFLIISFFFTYIIFSCSFNTFLIFLHNFCLSKKLLTHFSFYDFYSGFFFNWLFYVTENIYFFIYVNVYFIFFLWHFWLKQVPFSFFCYKKSWKTVSEVIFMQRTFFNSFFFSFFLFIKEKGWKYFVDCSRSTGLQKKTGPHAPKIIFGAFGIFDTLCFVLLATAVSIWDTW